MTTAFLAGMAAGALTLLGALVILGALAAWSWYSAGKQAQQEADAEDLSDDLFADTKVD